jgi:hypothetical protein
VTLPYARCTNGNADPYQDSGLGPRTEALLEHMLFKYAKENLVVVNIYIKVITFIMHVVQMWVKQI